MKAPVSTFNQWLFWNEAGSPEIMRSTNVSGVQHPDSGPFVGNLVEALLLRLGRLYPLSFPAVQILSINFLIPVVLRPCNEA